MSSTYLVPQTYSVLTAVTLADSMEAAPPMPDTLVPPTLSGINADDRPRVLFNDPLPADGEAWLTGYPIQRIMDRLPQKWAMLDAAGIAACRGAAPDLAGPILPRTDYSNLAAAAIQRMAGRYGSIDDRKQAVFVFVWGAATHTPPMVMLTCDAGLCWNMNGERVTNRRVLVLAPALDDMSIPLLQRCMAEASKILYALQVADGAYVPNDLTFSRCPVRTVGTDRRIPWLVIASLLNRVVENLLSNYLLLEHGVLLRSTVEVLANWHTPLTFDVLHHMVFRQ